VLLGASGVDGPTVTEDTALNFSAVWRAVSTISGNLAALPLRTLVTDRDGTRRRARSFLDNPGLDLLTAFEWKELAAVHLLLHGNVYAQHRYNGAGALVGLNLIHPLAVEVEWDADRVGGRKYTVRLDPANGGQGETHVFDALTLTHIPALSLDGLKGLSPITKARLSIGAGTAGDRAAHRMQTNGAMISGLVTPDADEDLTQEEARAVKDTVTNAMTGVENAGSVAVINRKLRFQPWQMSAVDAQFLASRAFSVEEIGRWFGLPPHMLGQTEKQTSWGSGLAEMNRGFARYTLIPWSTRIEQRLSRLISGTRIVEFDYSALLAPSPEDEIRLLLEQLNGGMLTANEVRRIRNLPPIEGGDTLRIPAGAADPNESVDPENVGAAA
jgi:HK97 family phage portal protein